MEELKSKAGDLAESITEYIQSLYKLTLLNAADKATTISATTMAALVMIFLGIFVLFFGGIALAIWLGNLLDDPALGYLLVAGFAHKPTLRKPDLTGLRHLVLPEAIDKLRPPGCEVK